MNNSQLEMFMVPFFMHSIYRSVSFSAELYYFFFFFLGPSEVLENTVGIISRQYYFISQFVVYCIETA